MSNQENSLKKELWELHEEFGKVEHISKVLKLSTDSNYVHEQIDSENVQYVASTIENIINSARNKLYDLMENIESFETNQNEEIAAS